MIGLPPIFWINLERCVERRERMLQRLTERGLQHERFVAVDGRDPAAVQRVLKSRAKRSAEAACIASHLLVIREAYARKLERVLILEDDSTFEPFDAWPHGYQYIERALPERYGAVALTYAEQPRELDRMYRKHEPLIRLGERGYWSSGAYVIERAGMRVLLDRYDCGTHFDITSFDDYQDAYKVVMRTLRDDASLSGPFISRVPLFLFEGDDSEIHPHHLPEHRRAREFALAHHRALIDGTYRSPFAWGAKLETWRRRVRRWTG